MNSIRETEKAQTLLSRYGMDGWLFCDFQGHDHITKELCGLRGRTCTRRLFYYVPDRGEPVKLLSAIEPLLLDHLPGRKILYKGRREMEACLKDILPSGGRIACQYSPEGNVPTVSTMDAGLAEYLRSLGVEPVSSADLLQYYGAVLTKEQIDSHREAGGRIHRVLDQSFSWLRRQLDAGIYVDEWLLLRKMDALIQEENLYVDGSPFLGADEHAADPGYEPKEGTARQIREGTRLIVDIAGRLQDEQAVFYDVSWCMQVGPQIDPEYQRLFDIVHEGREKARQFIQQRLNDRVFPSGCEVDALTRKFFEEQGLASYLMHRTGHSIGHTCHGIGANLDDYEAHDTRTLLPGTLFSIEPGIYKDAYGVRLEYDVYITPEGKTQVLGPVQDALWII